MKFLDSNIQDYIGDDFEVYKDSEGISYIKFDNENWIRNEDEYAKVFLGKCSDCSPFFKDSFTDFVYNKVLVAGLGFGLIPNELHKVNECSNIDVVEISQELIDYNNSSRHLNSDINLVQGDIFEYITDEKYDLIIIDTIWDEDEMSEEQVNILTTKFLNTNLNNNGVLYIPMKNKWIINK